MSCSECNEKDREERNCSNFKGLSDAARAVASYDEVIRLELLARKCSKVISLGDLRLYECPLSFITAETCEVMRMVFMMERGERFFSGGLIEEPCWAIEAFEIYQSERARIAGEKNGSKVYER